MNGVTICYDNSVSQLPSLSGYYIVCCRGRSNRLSSCEQQKEAVRLIRRRSVCNDVALGPGEGFMLHSDQNCPGIPALLDSRTGTAPVEGHTHTRTHARTHAHAHKNII